MIKLTNMKLDKQWEIESALSTLQRAEEIRKDSKMMKDVKKLADQRVKNLQSLAGSVSKKTVSRPKRKTLKRKQLWEYSQEQVRKGNL